MLQKVMDTVDSRGICGSYGEDVLYLFLFICQHTDSQNVAELFMYLLLFGASVTWLVRLIGLLALRW